MIKTRSERLFSYAILHPVKQITGALLLLAVGVFLLCQEESPPKSKEDTGAKSRGKVTQGAEAEAAKRRAERKKGGERAGSRAIRAEKYEKMLSALPVLSERREGYDRDAFVHWEDLDGNGCDAREDVLRRENLRPRGERCWDDRGLWRSAYDGIRTRNSSLFDVDHVVPLAEAWDSGAHRWPGEKREAFANDLPSLRAVSAQSNREKSDRDPAEWLPPKRSFWCVYIGDWIEIKYRWRLSIDPREKRTLRLLLRSC